MTRLTETELQQLARQGQADFKAELANANIGATARLEAAFLDFRVGINDALVDLQKTGNFNNRVTPAGRIILTRDSAIRAGMNRLKDSVEENLAEFARVTGQVAGQQQAAGVAVGTRSAQRNLQGVGVQFNRPSVDEIEQLINYVDNPVFQGMIEDFPQTHADRIGNIILTQASQGKSPLATARLVMQYAENYPLADAKRLVRTVQLYSAREGTREYYKKNREIVKGWRWSSALDKRTCVSCLALHGKVFTLDDPLNDHYNGRCAMIPLTSLNIGDPVVTGEEWLRGLPEDEQRAIMGIARWGAWKDGEFEFEDLTNSYDDPLFGKMYHSTSLKQLRATSSQRALHPERYRPIPTEINAAPYWEVRKIKPSDLDGGVVPSNKFVNDTLFGAFAYDDNANPIFDKAMVREQHNQLLYSIYKLGNSDLKPSEQKEFQARAGAILSMYEQTGIKQLTTQERRQLEGLAFGDLEGTAYGIKDNRMVTRRAAVYGGSSSTVKFVSAAAADGRAQLAENRRRQNE